jgi:cyclopropane fatty-acyl-phospholipid synthase-like methyltransferase
VKVTYRPEIFSVSNIEEAKAIILTAESSTTDARWEHETPLMCRLLKAHAQLGADSVVLDFGCGIGRMAKALIDEYSCRVIGVDISPSMRSLSVQYVNSDRFFSCSPEMLALILQGGLRFDLAISVWVLQHCLKPIDDIKTIRDGLKPGGGLFAVNNVHRAVPTRERGWVTDGIDIKAVLDGEFAPKAGALLVSPDVPASLSGITFWAMYEKR